MVISPRLVKLYKGKELPSYIGIISTYKDPQKTNQWKVSGGVLIYISLDVVLELMVQKSGDHQLGLVVYQIIYKGLHCGESRRLATPKFGGD